MARYKIGDDIPQDVGNDSRWQTFFYFLIFISHSQANMSIKIIIEKELHKTWFLELLGGLVLRVSVQLSVLILEV